MFGSAVLDVAIGMIFIYLLLSLICSAVNEIVEAWQKKRATDLEKGIRELLRDWEGTGIVKDLYNHPLVSGLYRGDYTPADLRHEARTGKVLRAIRFMSRFDVRKNPYRVRGLLLNREGADLPSYIPSRNFALALIDIVRGNASAPVASPPVSSPPAGSPPPGSPPAARLGAYSIEDLRAALNAYAGNENVRQALAALVGAAGDDLDNARRGIEKWFDSSMDRVSGWYKRRTQVIILFLGLGVAVFVNADTVAIFKSLMNDPAQRNSLVEAATQYAKSNPAPVGAPAPSPSPDPNSPIKACRTDANSPVCRVQRNLGEIEKLGLPLGWDCNDSRAVPQCVEFSPNPFSWVLWDTGKWPLWLPKVVGWVLTAIALSLGAPFWFDLLNKFMIVRSTVKPHEKSPEEKPIA